MIFGETQSRVNVSDTLNKDVLQERNWANAYLVYVSRSTNQKLLLVQMSWNDNEIH